jgi:thiamine-monophosphate kinase
LLGDLAHILNRSGVGATVEVDAVPRSAVLREQPPALQRLCTLAGGDDYELVFTAPPQRAAQVADAARRAATGVTRIGRIEADAGLRLVDATGRAVAHTFGSFDHFRD